MELTYYDHIGRKTINGDSIQTGSNEELIFEFRNDESGVGKLNMAGFIPMIDTIIIYKIEDFEQGVSFIKL